MSSVGKVMFMDNCPICYEQLNTTTFYHYYCLNGCYRLDLSKFVGIYIYIFENEFFIDKNFYSFVKERITNDILDLIEYYKKDDRYLAEIMSMK